MSDEKKRWMGVSTNVWCMLLLPNGLSVLEDWLISHVSCFSPEVMFGDILTKVTEGHVPWTRNLICVVRS